MNILVFIDATPRGEWAISSALQLARGLKLNIVLLTTADDLKQEPALLDRAADRLQAIPGISVTKKSLQGAAREVVLKECAASSPALTVFPPAGRHTLSRIIKGSRVKALVQSTPSTVMVARKPVSDQIRRVLVTVSGGPMSETTLRGAHEIASAVGASLSVLHVSSSVAIPFGEVRTEAPPSQQAPLKGLLDKLSEQGIEPRVIVRDGMVVHQILRECHDGGYDLLALGQHLADRETGGPLSENIAEILALESPIPVLIVRARRWAAKAGTD